MRISSLAAWGLGMVVGSCLAGAALACSCASQGTAKLLGDTEVAFLGTVIAVEKKEAADLGRHWAHRVAVEKVFKGRLPSEVELVTEAKTSCGYSYPLGARTVVFADRSGGKLWAHVCGQPIHGNPEPERLAALLAELPQGEAPAPPAGAPAPSSSPGWLDPGPSAPALSPDDPHAHHDCCDMKHEAIPGHPCRRVAPAGGAPALPPDDPHAQHDCCESRHRPVPGHPCKKAAAR